MKYPATTSSTTSNHTARVGHMDGRHRANSERRHNDMSRLLAQVEEAARVVAPLWPLSTFIAVNPLWDLRYMSFYDAIDYAAPILGIRGYPTESFFAEAYTSGRVSKDDIQAVISDQDINYEIEDTADYRMYNHQDVESPEVAATGSKAVQNNYSNETLLACAVDREITKWCTAYVGGMLPGPVEDSFYRAWRNIIGSDPAARRIAGKDGRKQLATMPENPVDTISKCLDRLSIAENDRVREFERRLARTLGWSGYAKWRSYWTGSSTSGQALTIVDLLAVRLSYETVLRYKDKSLPLARPATLFTHLRRRGSLDTRGRLDGRGRLDTEGSQSDCTPTATLNTPAATLNTPKTALKRVWLAAYENHYRDCLLKALEKPLQPTSTQPERPAAQAVFCIDTRSEGLRRHLEAAGRYETIGFAGFFSLPMQYLPLGSAEYVDQYPVLLTSAIQVTDEPATKAVPLVNRHITGSQGLAAAGYALNRARKGMLSTFMLAEAGGFFAGPLAAAKTLTPECYHKLRDWTHRMIVPRIETHSRYDNSISVVEQVSFASNLLTTMGLTRNFAPLVLLCGHGSTTENNPYASSLDCGACGGNRGAANARAAATLLNQPAVRNLLKEQKIIIPDDTIFIAGEHDTAIDKITILDLHLIPASHLEMVATLQANLNRAGAGLATERTLDLPGTDTSSRVALPAGRSADWAQVQPEWGLARNAAFIVAPRELTAGVDLGRRCFLHSYDSDTDDGGKVLETILTAPMVVAHWINAQYYFSTVDPEVLSAGDKTAHNIVAGVGVLQGAAGDLQVGLPAQSILDGNRPFHEPMRLLAIVQAPQARLESIIAHHAMLRELFDGYWVHLVARDHPHDRWKIRHPGGEWKHWEPAE